MQIKRLIVITMISVVILITFIIFLNEVPLTRTLVFPGEGTYIGQIKGSLFEGTGLWISENGSTYFGEFHNGYYEGIGTLVFANGATYIGEFKKGYMHGEGKIVFADHIYRGFWNADEMIKDGDECEHNN